MLGFLPKGRYLSNLLATALILPFAAYAQTVPLAPASVPFHVDVTTSIPSHTLAPGDYSIKILDSLADRYILRIDDSKGKPLATLIGLRNPGFASTNASGPILWTSAPHKKTSAFRGFAFPNGKEVEFVYPKAEAVPLAQLNSETVPAIDPESEGRPSDPKLSAEDRQIVTLWMLSPTRVGVGNGTPAIEAKRFQAAPEPPLLASAQPVPPSPASRSANPAEPDAGVTTAATPRSVARPKAHPAATVLPQTASGLPLLFLLSVLTLGAAFGTRLVRKSKLGSASTTV